MGSFTSSVGLVSGLPTADIINQLMAIEARPISLLQTRINDLQAERTAFLDVSARLLAIQNAIGNLAKTSAFRTSKAASSNDDVLTATVGENAALGTYSFRVRSLVSNHQLVSRGFSDADQTPVGGGTVTVEIGAGRVNRDTALGFLNGQQGVRRGTFEITDRSGASARVDITSAQTVGDVIDTINNTIGINVTASVRGDRIVLADDTGQPTSVLAVRDLGSGKSAADLGLVGSVSADEIEGQRVNVVTESTALRLLNDGNGVRRRDEAAEPDFDITLGDGTTFSVSLTSDLQDNTQLGALNDGAGVNLGVIRITDRSGASADIDLSAATNIGDVVTAINAADDIDVSIVKSGSRLTITDSTGVDVGNLIVEDVTGSAAADLGITGDTDLNEIRGRNIYDVSTVGDVLRAINFAEGNDGSAVASLDTADNRIVLTDNSGGGGALTVAASDGALQAAEDLGLLGASTGNTIQGTRLIAGLNTTLLRSLNGGRGVTEGDLTITNRQGVATTFNTAGVQSVQELIDLINASSDTSGITADINAVGNGIILNDTTTGTGNIEIADTQTAQDLGLVGSYAAPSANSGNLQLRYISEASRLADLNFGRGVAAGSIRITSSSGDAATISLTNAETVGDVLRTINGRVFGVTAEINENGDGIIIRDAAGGTGRLKIEEAGSTTARDLNILGEGEATDPLSPSTLLSDLHDGAGVNLGVIRISDRSGATEELDLTGATTLQDVVDALNASALNISASLTGTRLEIVDSSTPADPPASFQIEDVSGTAAEDLGINRTASGNTLTGFGLIDTAVDGSLEFTIDLASGDTLNRLASKLNGATDYVQATVINDGSVSAPYRLSLTSTVGGRRGEILFDSGNLDLGLTTLSAPRDAVVLIGGDSSDAALVVTSSSNTVSNLVPGVTLDLLGTSDETINVTVSRDYEAVVSSVDKFVKAYNDAVGRIDQLTDFNPDTEVKGILLGDSTISRIEAALGRSLLQTVRDVDPRFSRLSSFGISLSDGKLEFDADAFRDVLESDPDAVEAFFAGGEEAFGADLESLLKSFTDTNDGLIARQSNTIQSREDDLNDRIESLNKLLDSKRARLEREFSNLELALSQLQSQSSSLSALAGLASSAQSGISLI